MHTKYVYSYTRIFFNLEIGATNWNYSSFVDSLTFFDLLFQETDLHNKTKLDIARFGRWQEFFLNLLSNDTHRKKNLHFTKIQIVVDTSTYLNV